jgi:Phage integrase, N-terminal SAM-like domain
MPCGSVGSSSSTDKRHPIEMGETEVIAFRNHLVVRRDVAASTRNHAQSALLFLDKVVLCRPLESFDDRLVRAKRPERLPTGFSRDEDGSALAWLDGTTWLAASLLYGSGLRPIVQFSVFSEDVTEADTNIGYTIVHSVQDSQS